MSLVVAAVVQLRSPTRGELVARLVGVRVAVEAEEGFVGGVVAVGAARATEATVLPQKRSNRFLVTPY